MIKKSAMESEGNQPAPDVKASNNPPGGSTIQIRTVVRRIAETMAKEAQAGPLHHDDTPVKLASGKMGVVETAESQRLSKPVHAKEKISAVSKKGQRESRVTGSVITLPPETYRRVSPRRNARPLLPWKVVGLVAGCLLLIGVGVYAVHTVGADSAPVKQKDEQDARHFFVTGDDSLSKGKWIGWKWKQDPAYAYPANELPAPPADKQVSSLAVANRGAQSGSPVVNPHDRRVKDEGRIQRPQQRPPARGTEPQAPPRTQPHDDNKKVIDLPPVLKPDNQNNQSGKEAEPKVPKQKGQKKPPKVDRDDGGLFDVFDGLFDLVFNMGTVFSDGVKADG
ncbi:hypothetical protein C1X05_10395 [Laceyella sacchari]|uniref:Uncharacterized protein n=1 Tax=Laceyella tengchongensis TaxID=574699 RepID=A0AA45WKR5_9BACL|nr:hypothetical protein [Laceyella tengchongensis]AUS09192.1 hypothetical protein C1X05_10395 [Laceyella sacchari]SMP08483.1 hypothetical protein SAMN06265361_10233 [Laceyella tengchongensis]